MKPALYLFAILILGLGSLCSQAATPPSVSGTLVFLGSSDAPGAVAPDRLQRCLQHLAQELKVEDKEMPQIVVFHVSQRVGEAMGLKGSTVRRNTGQGAGPYFEVWLVGRFGPADYVVALESVLEDHFDLQNPQPERMKIMSRVLRYERSTVDVKAYGQ